MIPSHPHTEPDAIDLESSSQTELERTFGCDSDSVVIEPHAAAAGIAEPHHRRCPSQKRELLQNPFPSVD